MGWPELRRDTEVCMHPNAQRVEAALRSAGVETRVVEFTDSTRTAADAAATIGTTVAQIAKSLLFLAGDDPVLVIASGANRVSMDKLAGLTGSTVRRADADMVKRITGYPVGGVPPIGHPVPPRIVIDQDLLIFDEIWAAAGTPNSVFRITPTELTRVTAGAVADVREEID
jgi:prolyl-tRNA editing enzyme YbaK/EbsC (Cys-tRNA(Pro) deacylase)